MWFQLVLICFLVYILIRQKGKEGYQSPEIVTKKAKILYSNKALFNPHTDYSYIKTKIPWIDPVIYNDVFSLARKEKMSVRNIEKSLYI